MDLALDWNSQAHMLVYKASVENMGLIDLLGRASNLERMLSLPFSML